MSFLIKETSERSKKLNRAEEKINTFIGTKQISYEGVAIKDNRVTAVFDRGCYIKENLFNEPIENLLNEVKIIEPLISVKERIAEIMGVKWYFVFYDYSHEQSIVYDFSINSEVKRFSSFLDLGIWISQFSDTVNLSRYEENGLPKIDTIMRKNGYSWPGNMDGLLISPRHILCVIEYQNTSKQAVAEHDNNDWIKPTPWRKGDARRWLVIKLIADALKTKVVVIVWSYNENQIAIKPINNFILDSHGNVEKIVWEKKELCDINSLTEKEFLRIIEEEE